MADPSHIRRHAHYHTGVPMRIGLALILGLAAAIVSDPMVDRLTMFDHIYMVASVATFFVSWRLVMRITRAQSAKCAA